MAEVTYLEALRQGLWEEMERDDRVFILGEDVGNYGGAFKVTEGFVKQFGEARVIATRSPRRGSGARGRGGPHRGGAPAPGCNSSDSFPAPTATAPTTPGPPPPPRGVPRPL